MLERCIVRVPNPSRAQGTRMVTTESTTRSCKKSPWPATITPPNTRKLYVSGTILDSHSNATGIFSTGTSNPERKICGRISIGMNCTAWNSVWANALEVNPSAMPERAA